MFRYEMRSARMQTPSEETAHQEVDEWFPPKRTDKHVVEKEDAEEVDSVPNGRTLRTYEPWSKSVKKQLKRAIPALSLFLISIGGERLGKQLTYAKNVLPATLLSTIASKRLGRSVSIPSSPKNLWCSM